MKIVYMGTPDFAVAPLEAILSAGHEVTCVVTQPDKQKGRGKEMSASPVKECALQHQIPVITPRRIKEEESIVELKQYEADLYVVAAFGQILSEEILNIPQYGCINIHASLLPKYRGAAPIQWSIIDGEEETGITIMQMDKGLDTGDILLQESVAITPDETGDSLHDKLSEIGSQLVLTALEQIENGFVKRIKQDSEQSCYAKMLDKSMGELNYQKSALELERLIRGLNPWPSAYTTYQGKFVKIWKAAVVDVEGGNIGEVIKVEKDGFVIQTSKGGLFIQELQLQGKKRLTAKQFLIGHAIQCGEMFG